MIRHLLNMIWNQRKRNGWIVAEILLVFVALWYIIDTLMVLGKVYYSPMGWDIDHVYMIDMGVEELDQDAVDTTYQSVPVGKSLLTAMERIKTCPGVEYVGAGLLSMPFDGSNSYGGVTAGDSSVVDFAKINRITPGFMEVFNFHPADGEKKSWEEMLSGQQVILSGGIYQEFQEKGVSRDQGISVWEEDRKIGGVTNAFRSSRFRNEALWLFWRLSEEEIAKIDRSGVKLVVRVDPKADKDFPAFFTKEMEEQLSIDRLYLLDVIPYENIRTAYEFLEGTRGELQNQLAVMGFLLFNIFLGIIGTFWFRTEQRKGEMGLRIAMGSTRLGLQGIMMGEGVLLLTMVAIPACVICFNIQLLELTKAGFMEYTLGRFLAGFAITYLIIAMMILLGIWYPARQTSRLEPAEALHYE